MTGLGQKHRFDRRPVTSGLPRSTDILRVGRHCSKVPIGDIRDGAGSLNRVFSKASPVSPLTHRGYRGPAGSLRAVFQHCADTDTLGVLVGGFAANTELAVARTRNPAICFY